MDPRLRGDDVMFESGKVPISQHLSGPGADPGFGVYVHWPFCAQKCPYCDFNSHVRHNGWDETRFLAAYKRELDHVAALMATSPPPVWGRPGGGKSEVLAIGIPPTPNPAPQGAG